MEDFITLTCKSCGGKLQITPELDDFACMYCGTEYKVKREGGIVALSPLVEEMKKVSVSTDKTASELALVRLKEELLTLNEDLIHEQNRTHEWKRMEEKKLEEVKGSANSRKIVAFLVILIPTSMITVFILGALLNFDGGVMCITMLAISGIIFYVFLSKNPFDFFQRKKFDLYNKVFQSRLEQAMNKQVQISKTIQLKEKELEKHRIIVAN